MRHSNLPKPKSSKVFMWSLIDFKHVGEPLPYMISCPRFPVLTTSPNPLRYNIYVKVDRPMFTGLPLWTREELVRGYVLPSYVSYVSFVI